MSVTTTLRSAPPRRTLVRPDVPHAVRGRFRSVKSVLTGQQLALFFGLPWLRWDRGAGLPGQAILVDLPGRRIFVFGLEFWPQDLPIAVGLLVGAALGLFWATTVAGRVWCGFACPQTVWSDLFFALDRPRSPRAALAVCRLARRRTRHRLRLHRLLLRRDGAAGRAADGDGTDGSRCHDGGTHRHDVAARSLCARAGLPCTCARGRACRRRCSMPRASSSPIRRGGRAARAQAAAAAGRSGGGVGCVRSDPGDRCARCRRRSGREPWRLRRLHALRDGVPDGGHIRDGLQMGCIGCSLCIDACDDVMGKLERPRGLIRFDTESAPRRRSLEPPRAARVRPKALAFALAALVALGMSAWGAATLPELTVHVEPQRNPPFVRLSDGSVRNDYALRLDHRRPGLAGVAIHIDGLPHAELRRGAHAETGVADLRLPIGGSRGLDERLLVTLSQHNAPHGRTDIVVVFSDPATGAELARVDSYFWGPGS